jgi:phage tail-like protein
MSTGPSSRPVDPYRNFNFLVEIQGITQAGFSECTGFGASVDVTEYREGGDVTSVRKLPGLTKYTNITLKWGLTDSHELYDWWIGIVNGKIVRKTGSIRCLDVNGADKVRWDFSAAWPTKYDAPDFTAKGNDVAIDTLELVVEGLVRVVS